MILKEGRILLLSFSAAALLAQALVGWWLAAIAVLLAVASGYLYRSPDRDVPAAPLGIVSPADGTVRGAAACHDPFLERDSICITLEMGMLDAYSIRSPIEGKVMRRWHRAPGADREGEDEEFNYAVWIQTDEGDDVVLVMTRHSSWRAPRCYVHSGERVGQGQRCGMIRFGSPVQLFLPASTRIEIQAGGRVQAGADLVGTLVRKPAPVMQPLAAT